MCKTYQLNLPIFRSHLNKQDHQIELLEGTLKKD